MIELDDDLEFKKVENEKTLQKHIEEPDKILRLLCERYKMNFEQVMDEYLDYYNLISKQRRHSLKVDISLSALKESYMKEALYHTLRFMDEKMIEVLGNYSMGL